VIDLHLATEATKIGVGALTIHSSPRRR
jgi:hypothetical protein